MNKPLSIIRFYPFVMFFFCLFLSSYSAAFDRSENKPAPYKKMHDDPLVFTGHAAPLSNSNSVNEICIGLFVPDGSNHPAGQAVIQGATLAVNMANSEGGYQGRPFKIVRRWADMPWSAGSKEMIDFVYSDQAVAVISFLSASSHIAEQIATKTFIPVIAPVASDPSLTHARVPWIFRLPPDDQQQATALVKEVFQTVNSKDVGLITGIDQDSRMSATELEKEMIKQGIPPIFHHNLDSDLSDMARLAQNIRKSNPAGLIIRVIKKDFQTILANLSEAGLNCPVFIPWVPGLDVTNLGTIYQASITVIQPFPTAPRSAEFQAFSSSYLKTYQYLPSPSAALAFDALQIIITAVRLNGADRIDIRNGIAGLVDYKGVTGHLRWDTGGGNQLEPSSRKIN